jgi:hypothetical protein
MVLAAAFGGLAGVGMAVLPGAAGVAACLPDARWRWEDGIAAGDGAEEVGDGVEEAGDGIEAGGDGAAAGAGAAGGQAMPPG